MGLNARNTGFVAWGNKGTNQPVHLRSRISALIIPYLKSKVTWSDIQQFGELQHDRAPGYAPEGQYIIHMKVLCKK